MTSALVTGATGFVGSHLVDLLLERGYSVLAAIRRTSDPRWLEGKPVKRVEIDLSRDMALPECDLFFHVAGVIRAQSYRAYLEGNRDAARRALAGARTGRFVLVSSLAACGPGELLDETCPCRPISLYGRSKWEGEQEVLGRRGGIAVTVVRPPVVYGTRDSGLLDAYRIVARGFRPEIGARKWISLIHVRDLVEGLLLAAEAPKAANEVFFLADPEPIAMPELWAQVALSMGARTIRLPVPDRVVRWAGALVEDGASWAGKSTLFGRDKALEMTQKAWTCRATKAARMLGWNPRRRLDEAMRETLEWYKSRRLL